MVSCLSIFAGQSIEKKNLYTSEPVYQHAIFNYSQYTEVFISFNHWYKSLVVSTQKCLAWNKLYN